MKRSKQMKWRMTLTFMKSGENNRSKLMTKFYSIQSNFIHKLHDWFISRACYRWQPVNRWGWYSLQSKKIVDFSLLTFINHLLTFSYQINASLSTYVRYWGCIMTFGRWNRCTTIWLKRVYQRVGKRRWRSANSSINICRIQFTCYWLQNLVLALHLFFVCVFYIFGLFADPSFGFGQHRKLIRQRKPRGVNEIENGHF